MSKRFEVINPIVVLEKIKEGDLQSLYFFKSKFSVLMKNESEKLDELKQKDLIARIVKHTGVSPATIMRYLSAYRANDMEGLISNKGIGTNSRTDNRLLTICERDNPELILDTITVRLSEDQIIVLKEVIEQDYLTKLRFSKAAVHRIVERKCMERCVSDIKYITTCGIIDRIDEKVKETHRNPSKAIQIYDEVARDMLIGMP